MTMKHKTTQLRQCGYLVQRCAWVHTGNVGEQLSAEWRNWEVWPSNDAEQDLDWRS